MELMGLYRRDNLDKGGTTTQMNRSKGFDLFELNDSDRIKCNELISLKKRPNLNCSLEIVK